MFKKNICVIFEIIYLALTSVWIIDIALSVAYSRKTWDRITRSATPSAELFVWSSKSSKVWTRRGTWGLNGVDMSRDRKQCLR